MEQNDLLTMTSDIVAAHVSNNTVQVSDIPTLVQSVHEALFSLGQPQEEEPEQKVGIVSIRASVKPDYLVCMECGRKQKTLRRHLQSAHGMTPEQYRADYGLPNTYPMTASNYSEKRSEMAKSFGLGRKKGESRSTPKGGTPKPRAKKQAPVTE